MTYKINEFGEIIRDIKNIPEKTSEEKMYDEYIDLEYSLFRKINPIDDPEKMARFNFLKEKLGMNTTDVLGVAKKNLVLGQATDKVKTKNNENVRLEKHISAQKKQK